MINGDLNPPPITHNALTFAQTDVSSWPALANLFKVASETAGSKGITHVFANAGISPRNTYLEGLRQDPATGELLEPDSKTLDVNLKAVANTVALGVHYFRQQLQTQEGQGRERVDYSIVLTASASSYQRFRTTDYTAAKHGVLGLLRGLVPNLLSPSTNNKPLLPIRVNAIAPSWTRTGIAPGQFLRDLGVPSQGPEVVARCVGLLMADGGRWGEVVYIDQGRFWEIEEAVLLPAAGRVRVGEDEEAGRMVEMTERMRAEASVKG